MKESLERSETYVKLEEFFRTQFLKDGDFRTYAEIQRATGVDIRSSHSKINYQVFDRLRSHLRLSSDPLMLEVRRGEGVERIRIGIGAYSKGIDAIQSIRRRSQSMIDLAQNGRLHAIDDEESHKNQTVARIYSAFLARTSRDALNDEFSVVSNGAVPSRPFVSLRQILRRQPTA